MILRRYGESLHSVELNFDSKALTEIGFRRDRQFSIPADAFGDQYEQIESHELAAEKEGDVQDEVEQGLLLDLEGQIRALEARLEPGGVLRIDSEQGVDYPKTRTQQRTIVVQGENRLHFTIGVSPPLRVSLWRKSARAGA